MLIVVSLVSSYCFYSDSFAYKVNPDYSALKNGQLIIFFHKHFFSLYLREWGSGEYMYIECSTYRGQKRILDPESYMWLWCALWV